MTMTGFMWPLDWLFQFYTAKPPQNLPEPEDREAAQMTVRDYLFESEQSCCESEYGAMMLMAMFPREM